MRGTTYNKKLLIEAGYMIGRIVVVEALCLIRPRSLYFSNMT
jgi:hypothetical protein